MGMQGFYHESLIKTCKEEAAALSFSVTSFEDAFFVELYV